MSKLKSKTKQGTFEAEYEAAESTEDKLRVVTKDLGHHYALWKGSEATKDLRRDLFFETMTDFVAETVPLEKSTERVILKDGEDIEKALQTRYRDKRVATDGDGDPLMDVNPDDSREWIVVLEDDPEFVAHFYLNPDDGLVYRRGRTERGASFDTQGLMDEYPEIAAQCVDVRYAMSHAYDINASQEDQMLELLSTAEVSYVLDQDKAEALVVEDPSLMPIFMKFRIAPKVSMRLLEPKPEKEKK